MLEKFGLPYREHLVGLYDGTLAEDLAPLAPARLVPVLRLPDGTVVGETLAMAQTLAERHPDAGLWPADPAARASARWLCAAMAAGFGALRGSCPMQLHHVWEGFVPTAEVREDVARIEELWRHARGFAGGNGPWLFGAYSLADAFYTPVAARIVGYGLPVSEAAAVYCRTVIDDPAFKKWRNSGLEKDYSPYPYELGLPRSPWPGDAA